MNECPVTKQPCDQQCPDPDCARLRYPEDFDDEALQRARAGQVFADMQEHRPPAGLGLRPGESEDPEKP